MTYELDELEPHELWELLSHVPLHADEIKDALRDELAVEESLRHGLFYELQCAGPESTNTDESHTDLSNRSPAVDDIARSQSPKWPLDEWPD